MIETVSKKCVVLGASHAGCQAAESVRKFGWEGEIILIGDEPYLPYHRPPLSKEYLAGKKEIDNLFIKPALVYEKNNIELRLSESVESIDRQNKTLTLSDNKAINYDKLVLTVGARARQIPIPGIDNEGVFYLRTIADIDAIHPLIREAGKAVLVGGGYIGLEAAAVLRSLGMEVTILEMMPRILQRVTAPVMSDFYQRIHTEQGVNIVTDVKVNKIEKDGDKNIVGCEDGSKHEADLVIIGAGVVPNIELAREAGLECNDNGIIVDEFCTTSDSDIFAAGDCTWHYNPLYQRWLRLESVPNASDQARTCGAAVCDNRDKPNDQLPWFWSDQYDIKLQIAGLSNDYDEVITRGNPKKEQSFAAFYFANDKLIAVDAVNMPIAFLIGKKLIAEGKQLDKSKLSDMGVDLKTLI